jgi:hypothetical protein
VFPDPSEQIGFAIPKSSVSINTLSLREIVMAGLFDVSQEIILVTGASQRGDGGRRVLLN